MIRTKTNKITAIQISRMIKIQEIPIKTIKIREIQTKTTAEKMMTPMIKTTIKIKIKIKTKTKTRIKTPTQVINKQIPTVNQPAPIDQKSHSLFSEWLFYDSWQHIYKIAFSFP